MRPPISTREPFTLLIAALGGQGGGVLTDWIVDAARSQGFGVQATSTPGVSQRTGATTYYVELATEYDAAPVFALMPMPGRVDVLVCAELLEAARMLERGMCTPTRTTVIASTHRVYTTVEKMSAGDGRFDGERIINAVQALARHAVLFDMESVRARHGAAISAVLFGALAGSGALPLSRHACEDAIRAAGKGVAASAAAFGDAYECAAGFAVAKGAGRHSTDPAPVKVTMPLPAPLAKRIARLPARVAEFADQGTVRVFGYQDAGYAARYLDRVEGIVRAEAATAGASLACEVARETARHLALWMCYEDVIRVASQKARESRQARIRLEVAACDGDVVRVYEAFNPSVHEFAAILPRRVGEWLEQQSFAKGPQPSRGRGIKLQTSSVTGALALRFAAALRPLRPFSLRFAREQAAIDDWLGVVAGTLASKTTTGLEVALEIARLPRLQKGYGDTHANGRENFRRMLQAFRDGGSAGLANAASTLRNECAAVLDDPDSARSDRQFAAQGMRARSQPIVWADRHGRS